MAVAELPSTARSRGVARLPGTLLRAIRGHVGDVVIAEAERVHRLTHGFHYLKRRERTDRMDSQVTYDLFVRGGLGRKIRSQHAAGHGIGQIIRNHFPYERPECSGTHTLDPFSANQ